MAAHNENVRKRKLKGMSNLRPPLGHVQMERAKVLAPEAEAFVVRCRLGGDKHRLKRIKIIPLPQQIK
jgi:hypothetical protein